MKAIKNDRNKDTDPSGMKAVRLEMWMPDGLGLQHPVFNLAVQKRNYFTSEFNAEEFAEFKRRINEFQARNEEIKTMPEYQKLAQITQEHRKAFSEYVRAQMDSHKWAGAKK
jgi:hypothetical protein